MSANARDGLAPDPASDVRTLPARPNLEFERKQAKKLLALLKKGDPEALARVRAKLKGSNDTKPDEFKLADAQFTIAREYGFTSWPRLVEYFETLVRHEISGPREQYERPRSGDDGWPRTIVAEHRDKRVWTAQMLTAYVPRFYGRTIEQVFAAEVTLDDAKLAAARMRRYPSWEAMVSDTVPYGFDAWKEYETPLRRAMQAVRAGDLDALTRLVKEHPELLRAAESSGHPRSDTLARNVLLFDVKAASPESRRAYDWLRERIDMTETLNWMQLGYMRMTTEEMQRILERGADPTWIPPNGYSVLEHVIWRCWNGEIVDLVAKRVKPREAFWIAAGIGDVDAVKRYVDERGGLTEAARENRPDFTSLGYIPMPQNPAPDDEEIVWEAFIIAGFNQRFSVLDVLLDRGFPIDYIKWGQTLLHLAVGNGWLPLVEYLVRRGANLDLKGWRPYMTAREGAEAHALNPYGSPNAKRILEICGGRDIDTLERERQERRAKRVMQTSAGVEQAFEFAKQDAVAMARPAVDQESLFIGLLRQDRLGVSLLGHGGVNLPRLRQALLERLERQPVQVPAAFTADPEVSSILMDARTIGEKEELLGAHHVLYALMKRASDRVLDLIQSAGSSREKVLAAIEDALPPEFRRTPKNK